MDVVKEGSKEMIENAVKVLSEGELIIYPTETCYGIGADVTNREAIQNVYAAKRRPESKPISVVFSDIKMVKKFIDLNNDAIKLVEKFMPGPLTIVVKNDSLPKNLGAEGKIGFRIPNRESVRKIIKKFGKPITSTSANISQEPPIYDPNIVKEKFWMNVSLLIDGGILNGRAPSTVFDVEKKLILREGEIKEEDIMKVLKS